MNVSDWSLITNEIIFVFMASIIGKIIIAKKLDIHGFDLSSQFGRQEPLF